MKSAATEHQQQLEEQQSELLAAVFEAKAAAETAEAHVEEVTRELTMAREHAARCASNID